MEMGLLERNIIDDKGILALTIGEATEKSTNARSGPMGSDHIPRNVCPPIATEPSRDQGSRLTTMSQPTYSNCAVASSASLNISSIVYSFRFS